MVDEKKLIEELRKKGSEYDKDCGYWYRRGECANGLICAGKCTGIVQAIKIVEQQPKVCEWIPCSVELPVGNGKFQGNCYEVTIDDGKKLYTSKRSFDFASKKWMIRNAKVIAWRPLPEPYRPCANTDCVYNSGKECPASEGCAGYQSKGE